MECIKRLLLDHTHSGDAIGKFMVAMCCSIISGKLMTGIPCKIRDKW